jgi:hypothetical protein
MQKVLNSVLLSLGLIGFSVAAHAANKVDFTAQSLRFGVGLDDDVSGAQSQHVTLTIKNVGNTPSRYPGSIMRVLLNGAVINANVYGPNGVGGYNLNAPIPAGQTGLALFSLPLGTLRHCQAVAIDVDADRTYQYGGDVFGNDHATLKAIDAAAIRICLPDVIHRPLPRDMGVDAEDDAAD